MTDSEIHELMSRAEEIYFTRLRAILEPGHLNEFVAIEPESGDYFLGRTLSEASREARRCHPGRPTHVMRIGHSAAVHIGTQLQ